MKSLIFKKINVDSMPGMSKGLKPMEGLSSHINIITGPNASGKSSTARAIQSFIWDDTESRIKADADGSIGDDTWKFIIDSSLKKVQKNGSDSALSGIPTEESKRQYMLSLHELIKADESGLAEKIQREAIGGYDIEKAKNNLEYRDSKFNRGVNEFKDFSRAEDKVDAVSGNQKDLKNRQDQLNILSEKRDEAIEANKRLEFFKIWKEFVEKATHKSNLKESLSEYPDVMSKVKEDDFSDIENLNSKIALKQKEISDAGKEIEKIQNLIDELNLPESDIEESDFKLVKNTIEKLKGLDSNTNMIQSEIEELKEKRDQVLQNIDENIDKESFDGVDLSDIEELDEFWQNAYDTYGEKRSLLQNIEAIKSEQTEPKNSSLISTGITELSKWLKTGHDTVTKPIPIWVWILIFVIGLGTAVVLHLSGPIGYVGIGVLAILLIYAFRKNLSESGSNEVTRIRDYKETGLKEPEVWDAEHVISRLQSLIDELHVSKYQDRLSNIKREKEQELVRTNDDVKSVEDKLKKLKDEIDAVPELEEKKFEKYSSLFWVLSQLREWTKYDTELSGKNSGLEDVQAELSKLLGNCNRIYSTYNLEEADNYIQAKTIFEEFEEKRQVLNDCSSEIEKLENSIGTNEERCEELREELNGIYNRLNVEPGEKFQVKKFVDSISEYQKLKEEINLTNRQIHGLKEKLEQKEAYKNFDDKLDNVTLEEIEDWIRKDESVANTLEELNNEINSIETLVEKAKNENNLEEAIARKEEALTKLDGLYRKNASLIAGHIISEKVKEHISRKNMPEVFERAKSLFSRITKGKYELIVSGSKNAEFKAIDTLDGIGRNLDELSTGTKIQLLMSVRLAFIEESETEMKLPILADELLANSDDRRAEAIIDALLEISNEGRQIFYFTAQRDEILKWKTKLENYEEVELNIHNLSSEESEAVFNLGEELRQIDGVQLVDDEVPSPDGKKYSDYKKDLNVPSFNVLLDEVGQLHLWYVFDDADQLYKVLSSGIDKWGMFENFISNGGLIKGISDKDIDELKSRGKIIHNYTELVKHGNDKQISRSVLEESGAVSSSFIDEVSEKLKEYYYFPSALIKALERSEVSGFRNNKIKELQGFLVDNEYISNSTPYSPDEIQSKFAAFVSTLNVEAEAAQDLIDRLLNK